MIQQDLESAVKAAIKAATDALELPATIDIRGVWDVADEGEAKAVETAPDAIIQVGIGNPAMDEYGSGGDVVCSFACLVELKFRVEQDAPGAAFFAVAEALQGLFLRWASLVDSSQDENLSTSNFVPGGVMLSGGGTPSLSAGRAWSVSWNLTIKGTLSLTAN